ncbi:GMP synthase [glutamine-hydrolyzing], amidotransferase subunit / GMP synthase [glutamine-hydrolyzing], ATP pyrophosphatase subunit, partial [hydrothermal vent metagenome]
MEEKILILDFGSQYTQLIARRVRELNVFCEIHPFNKIPSDLAGVKGVIYSGSPYSVRSEDSPRLDTAQFNKFPLLGVCYGAQLMAQTEGGSVEASTTREYGRANLSKIDFTSELMKGISLNSQVWMSHGDTITNLPESFEIIASTESVKVAAYKVKDENRYGIQFHPEVTHTTEGQQVIKNFIINICGCTQDWTPDHFVDSTVAELKEKIGSDKVVLGLSGGVDSSVAAMLLHNAIGSQLHCIFVDNGLLRKNEFESVLESYQGMGLNVKGVDSKAKFYKALKGLADPEDKRKAIGKTFIE